MALLLELPDEILVEILSHVPVREMLRCQRVSRRFVIPIRNNFDRMQKFEDAQIEIRCDRQSLMTLSSASATTPARRFVFDIITVPYGNSRDVTFSRANLRLIYAFSTSSTAETLRRTIRRLKKHFTLSTVGFSSVSEAVITKQLTRVPNVTAIKLQNCSYTMESLLQIMRRLKNLDSLTLLNTPKTCKILSQEFFERPEVQKLKALRIADTDDHMVTELNDQLLASMNNLTVLEVAKIKNEITTEGVKKLVEEWKNCERRITRFIFELEKTLTTITEQQLKKALKHRCNRGCTKESQRSQSISHRLSAGHPTAKPLRLKICGDAGLFWNCELFEEL